MDLNELLGTKPEDLAQKQYDALLTDTKARLSAIISHLDNGKFETIRGMLEDSPSGDCMGCDNSYISFAVGDIEETIEKLQQLKAIAGD